MIPAQKRVEVWMTVFFVFALANALLLPEAGAQSLDPSAVPKFVDSLPRVCGLIPTYDHAGNPTCMVMPTASTTSVDHYTIAERQFQQQILPAGFNKTTVWGFGPANEPASHAGTPGSLFHSPGATIVASFGRAAQIKWINDLVCHGAPGEPPGCATGNFLTYPRGVPVHTDIHWANPSQVCAHGTGTDCQGREGTYFGPVPTVVHLHGIRAESDSDGIPEAWNLPVANNIPGGFATHGSDYCQVDSTGKRNCPYKNDGAALFQYPNLQYPTTLFFHDHTLGVTLQNLYMGLVGFYLLGGGVNQGLNLPIDCGASNTKNNPSCVTGGLPGGDYEIPLAIQDKSFNTDGSLLLAEEGNIKVVNGKTWPYLEVEPRKYRFRIVNGSAARYMGLIFQNESLEFTQIGADAGFLPSPAVLSVLRITPGERADVIVDFSRFRSCTGPWCTVNLIDDNSSGDVRQVMQFRVVKPLKGTDTSVVPSTLPHHAPLGPEKNSRAVALVGELLGIFQASTPAPMLWDDPITESIKLGPATMQYPHGSPVVERWDMYNFSPDSHPMHLHEVQFEVVNREKIATGEVFNCTGSATNHFGSTVTCTSPPLPGETGFKDTVPANVGEITRVRVRFGPDDAPLDRSPGVGLFAWHCHIVPHEDNQMMRPLCIVAPGSNPVPGADGIVPGTSVDPACPSLP